VLAMIAFGLSFLAGPFMHGATSLVIVALVIAGVFAMLPAIAGGVTGLALHRFNLRPWWFVAAGTAALSLVAFGPPK